MIYKNLRIKLAEKNLSKSDLYEKLIESGCDIKRCTFDRQLSGKSKMSFGLAGAIATVLESNMSELFEEDNE